MILVNGTNKAHSCGLFDFGSLSGTELEKYCVQESFDVDGSMTFLFCTPHISKMEIEHFYNSNLKASKCPLFGRDYYAVNFRGALTSESLLVPYEDDRLSKFDGKCECWLVDSATDEIKGYKVVNFSDSFRQFLVENETKMKVAKVTEKDLVNDYCESLLLYSTKELDRRASYITTGRTVFNAPTDFNYVRPKLAA